MSILLKPYYTCSHCNRQGVWTKSWCWWPAERHGREKHWHDPEPEYIACCQECRDALIAKHGLADFPYPYE